MRDLINITDNEGQHVVSSRDVAEHFKKRHADVVRAIDDKISLNAKLRSANLFIESNYKDSSGKLNKEYLLTRDGFSFIVMGFTGEKADEWKLKYIEAFNKLEAKYKNNLIELQNEAFIEITMLKLQVKELESKVNIPVKIGVHDIDAAKVLNYINELAGYRYIYKDIHYKVSRFDGCLAIDFRRIFKELRFRFPCEEMFRASARTIERAIERTEYWEESNVVENMLDPKSYSPAAVHVMLLDVGKLEDANIFLDNLY